MLQRSEYILAIPLFLIAFDLGHEGIKDLRYSVETSLFPAAINGTVAMFFARKPKHRREKLVENREVFEDEVKILGEVLEGVGEGVAVIKGDMRIMFANSIFRKRFGNGILGQRCYDVLPDPSLRGRPCGGCKVFGALARWHKTRAAATYKAAERIKLNSSWGENESRVEQRYGDRYVEYFIHPFFRWAVYIYGRDVTERKKTERILLRAHKLASVGQLAAGAVHEVNNYLGNIILYADALLRKSKGRDKEKLEVIKEQAELAAGRIKNLLEFSRATENEHDTVSLRVVIHKCLTALNPMIKQKRIKVKQQLLNEATVRGNAMELQQAFTNIILNALQAMPKDGRLNVSIKKGNGEVRVKVSDSGIGIPSSDLGKVFDPFYTTKDQGKGTGLGLFIARMIVSNHRGEIWVESVQSKGSTFTIVLPVGE